MHSLFLWVFPSCFPSNWTEVLVLYIHECLFTTLLLTTLLSMHHLVHLTLHFSNVSTLLNHLVLSENRLNMFLSVHVVIDSFILLVLLIELSLLSTNESFLLLRLTILHCLFPWLTSTLDCVDSAPRFTPILSAGMRWPFNKREQVNLTLSSVHDLNYNCP